jgi:trans-AT polyketide synthase/acyltransferase/oxidoreductase domain-containing protein
MKVCMFPGQGAQRPGMGGELFPAFAALVQEANDILGYDIAALCRDGPAERLGQTQFTQPALFVVGALAWLRRRQTDPSPDYVLGHSVGEYAALFAAGVLDFADGLRLVAARGALMQQATGGGMAAVLGLDQARVEAVLARHAPDAVFVSNINTPLQLVVSGRQDAVVRLESAFVEAGAALYRRLDVSGAFHTPFMREAQAAFAEAAAKAAFSAPTIPVLSNVSARLHDPARIREAMIAQITAPVRWSDSIRALLGAGVSPEGFEELGAATPVLKPMVARVRQEAASLGPPPPLAAEPAPVPLAPRTADPRRSADGPGPRALSLGSRAFCERFGVRQAYVAGGMYQGIASVDVVARMAQAGMLSFFGAGGLDLQAVAAAVAQLKQRLPAGAPFGVNFLAHSHRPELEDQLVDLLVREGIDTIEASAFMQVTPALVRYRALGLAADGAGVAARHRIIAKVSRPDVAAQFLQPAPEAILAKLLASGALSSAQADLARQAPVADAVCVEADSGGHTDQGMLLTLLPTILRLRDRCAEQTPRFGPAFVGAAGGIGTPEAAAAVFLMGADFILTGSINQCTAQAATSDAVKDLLAGMNVHDTDYAPSGEAFEMGSKIQVLKKGIFFPARANKLAQLYGRHDSLATLDAETRGLLETRYFKRSLDAVFEEVRVAYPGPDLDRAERMPKQRMSMVFRMYFRDSTRWALAGDLDHKVDFQIQCGPALGAFNQWVADTPLADWRERHVDALADRMMDESAALLGRRLIAMQAGA